MDEESCEHALRATEVHEGVFAAIGRHPNEATGYDDTITDQLRELARHPNCRAIGETGLDYYRDYAPREDQERAFAAQIEIAWAPTSPEDIRGPRSTSRCLVHSALAMVCVAAATSST